MQRGKNSSPVTLQWRRTPTRRLLALFAFPQTVTLQRTTECREVSHYPEYTVPPPRTDVMYTVPAELTHSSRAVGDRRRLHCMRGTAGRWPDHPPLANSVTQAVRKCVNLLTAGPACMPKCLAIFPMTNYCRRRN